MSSSLYLSFWKPHRYELRGPTFCLEVATALTFSPDGKKVLAGSSKERRVMYTDASKSLSFPDVDASEMAKALRNTGERLFGDQVYLQGMSGTALKEGKYVDIMTLFQSLRTLVPKLAQSIKKVLTPVIAAPKGTSSFPIGVKDESVKIEVAQLKPVVIWSYFQDRE